MGEQKANKKCEMCKVKVTTLWPRIINGKRKMLCEGCKDFYER